MSLKKIVVLRQEVWNRDRVHFGAGPTGSPSALGVETREASPRDLRDLSRDPSVHDWAEDMPLQLIGAVPRTVDDGNGGGDGAITPPQSIGGDGPPVPTWGVTSVGAAADSDINGRGVKVAVLDTGIDATHPAFANIRLEVGKNVKNFTAEREDGDVHGHGTHCAATIFGRDIARNRIGIARGVTDVLIGKVLGNGGGSFTTIANALQWAFAEGAHVVSMSLGIDFDRHLTYLRTQMPFRQATSQALTDYGACLRVFDQLCERFADRNGIFRGMLVICAAGNESQHPEYAVSVAPPANAFAAVSVAALGPGRDGGPLELAPFSNRFATLAAPGVDIISAKLGGGLISLTGTSMAAPHVAGVAALHAQQRVALAPTRFSPQAVMKDINDGALRLPHLAPEDVGAGLVRAPAL